VEIGKGISYCSQMSQLLEKRVEDLERKVADLSAQILDLRPSKKDWTKTIGTIPDDEFTREADRLGQEYRKQQTYAKEIAGS
jgi:hypothetical protein